MAKMGKMAGETEVLQELGLTANEAKLYFLLVRQGTMKATNLAEESGLQRRSVYDTLQQLERKGMVGKSDVAGVAVFSPSPPSSLLSFLDEKRNSAEKLLPSLSRSFEAESRVGASVMHGIQGVKTVLADILATRSEFCVYYGQLQTYDALPKYMQLYHEKRQKLGIKARYVLLDTPNARERAKTIPLAEFKFIDPSSPSPGVWWTYADRLALVLWHKEPTIILIRSKDLAATFKKTFELEFNSKTKIYRGDEGMRAILEETLNHKETLFMGATGQASERYHDYLVESFIPRALKRKHKWVLLSNRKILATPAATYPISVLRMLPADWEYSPNVVWIYGNYVANVVWLPVPVAFVVEDAHVANAYRNYFWLMWKTAGKK